MLTWSDLGIQDEDLAREIMIVARDIAPCLATLEPPDENALNALAVLRRVASEITSRGSRSVKAQRIGSASVDYTDVASAFAGQPTRALRALCAASVPAALPRGSFPADRPISRLWPEKRS